MEKIKVLIADDHRVVREGLRPYSRPKKTSMSSVKHKMVRRPSKKPKPSCPM